MNAAGLPRWLTHYWGKARPDPATGPASHPLAYHSLDVAACGLAYWQQTPALRAFFVQRCDLPEPVLGELLAAVLALHDLGKFSDGFQGLREDLYRQAFGAAPELPYGTRHDSLGYGYWREVLVPHWGQQSPFGVPFDRQRRQAFEPWMRAVTGHHGQPPTEDVPLVADAFREGRQDAEAFSAAVVDLMLSDASRAALAGQDGRSFRRAAEVTSWWLAGLAVLADWLGSNQRFFAYRVPDLALEDYWLLAGEQARVALQATELAAVPATGFRSLHDLQPEVPPGGETPLQRAAATVSIAPGPQLFVIEDLTGAGKTEAALILAQRLLASGQAQGLYFALPTMATADAMYLRVGAAYARLFEPGTPPSLVLAHSASALSDAFRDSVLPTAPDESEQAADVETASARCNAWLADSRKKALLAQVGVGTVDQALQAVLKNRHQSLRVLGLFGKLLIVDEVHACDAYMARVLERLLTLHASANGSALLLSASLPMDMRQRFAAAWHAGRELDAPMLDEEAYPLLTQVTDADTAEIAVDARPGSARRVAVELLPEESAVLDVIEAEAQAGRCVCWIRNTVRDAQEAYERLVERGQLDRGSLHLFHARYALGDRLAIERALVERFGKHGAAVARRGQVVIATQVVEQSLDLDFDAMISDLAPVDRLIQRAGRLMRHARLASGERTTGADQRGEPRLHVYGPLPVDDAGGDWFAAAARGASFVYPSHGQLWLTARLLHERGGFSLPADMRPLLEAVYGEREAERIPQALRDRDNQELGDQMGERSHASDNCIVQARGYSRGAGGEWWQDVACPTRLGEPAVTVVLARWDGQRLHPFAEGANAWPHSEVQLATRLVARRLEPAEPDLRAALAQAEADLPGGGRWRVLVPFYTDPSDSVMQARVLNQDDLERRLTYDSCYGVRLR